MARPCSPDTPTTRSALGESCLEHKRTPTGDEEWWGMGMHDGVDEQKKGLIPPEGVACHQQYLSASAIVEMAGPGAFEVCFVLETERLAREMINVRILFFGPTQSFIRW